MVFIVTVAYYAVCGCTIIGHYAVNQKTEINWVPTIIGSVDKKKMDLPLKASNILYFTDSEMILFLMLTRNLKM